MATPYLKSWTPSTTYEFDLRIGDRDYSNDLYKVSIKSSVITPYQNITLELYLDSTDLLLEKIYGQTPIELVVTLKGETTWAQQSVGFDLMFSDTESTYHMQRADHITDQVERTPITFTTVSRSAFKTMSALVNDVYFNTTPEALIRNIFAKNTTKAQIEYDTNGKNTQSIDQFLIPPSTVYQTVNYLDRTYGVFNGMLGFHCSHDNIMKVQNLSKKIGSSQAFTVYTLATDINQEKILNMDDADKFYTKIPIKVLNKANSTFAVVSPRNLYITKPRDRLSHTINVDTEQFSLNRGIISPPTGADPTIFYDSAAINKDERMIYRTNQTGYDLEEGFVNANLSREVADVSLLLVELQHRLPILNLMNVGEAVNLIPQVTDYKSLGGRYVLKASDIGWTRSKVWESWARLYLMRTNISSV